MAWASLKPGAAVFLAVVVARMLAVLPNFDACRVAARCIRLEALKIPVENRTPPPEDSQTRLPLAGNATDRAGFPETVAQPCFRPFPWFATRNREFCREFLAAAPKSSISVRNLQIPVLSREFAGNF